MEFNDFEKILKKSISEFKEIEKFGFVGFMGSLNIKRDLDLIINPNKNIKKGEFLKSLCNFIEVLKKNCQKEKCNLICFTHSTFQEEVEFLSKRKEGDIFLHINSFPDLIPLNEEVIKSITNAEKSYFGNHNNIKLIQATNKDYYYNYLFFINCLYSRYPKKLEDKKIKERISYIFKHNSSSINFSNKTNKEIYFECCDFLDKISKTN